MVGYYNGYKDNGKTMNFKLHDHLLNKIYDILEHTEEKLKIDLVILLIKVILHNTLKQKYLMKHALEKTRIKQTNIISSENTKYD